MTDLQPTVQDNGTCCQCDNAMSAGGHRECQRGARKALERMAGELREIDGIAREYLTECSDYSMADQYIERIRQVTRNV